MLEDKPNILAAALRNGGPQLAQEIGVVLDVPQGDKEETVTTLAFVYWILSMMVTVRVSG